MDDLLSLEALWLPIDIELDLEDPAAFDQCRYD
jgi:hypothetical protein